MNTAALQALSDPNRLSIVRLLASGEQCVCDISSALDISNALASHHIKKLREAGLISTRRGGAWLHCRLRDEAVAELAGSLQALADLARDSAAQGCCSCLPIGGDRS